MDNTQVLLESHQTAAAPSPASGLALKHRWIAAVLEEVRQANAAIEIRYGRSRAMWRDASYGVSGQRAN